MQFLLSFFKYLRSGISSESFILIVSGSYEQVVSVACDCNHAATVGYGPTVHKQAAQRRPGGKAGTTMCSWRENER